MHEPIKGELETLLTKDSDAVGRTQADWKAHLGACGECTAELNVMKRQAAQFHRLRTDALVDPDPGFYARVLQKIDEQESDSIWSFLAASRFSRRLAYVSLSVAIALGTYVAVEETKEKTAAQSLQTISDSGVWHYENSDLRYDNPVIGSPDEQREAVLAHFADYRGTAQ